MSNAELDPRGQGPDAPWHLIGSRKPVFDEGGGDETFPLFIIDDLLEREFFAQLVQ